MASVSKDYIMGKTTGIQSCINIGNSKHWLVSCAKQRKGVCIVTGSRAMGTNMSTMIWLDVVIEKTLTLY